MKWISSDQAAGAIFLALALCIVLEARSFTVVGFLTDPLGPAALPYLVAAILALGATLMLALPGEEADWPSRAASIRCVLATGCLLAYAPLLPFLGFLLATSLIIALLSLLFGGRPARSGLAAFIYAGALYLLFGVLLDLPLPTGSLFIVGAP